MAVTSEISSVSYAGNNSSVIAYAVPFLFYKQEHVEALVIDADGVETELNLTSDFTVTGEGDEDGGTLTTTAAWDSSHTITIRRSAPILQPFVFEEGQRLGMKTLEKALDWITMHVQKAIRIASDVAAGLLGKANIDGGNEFTGDQSITGNLVVSGTLTCSNVSGSNTGDQTSIVGITGTKAQFQAAMTDDDFMTRNGAQTLTYGSSTGDVFNILATDSSYVGSLFSVTRLVDSITLFIFGVSENKVEVGVPFWAVDTNLDGVQNYTTNADFSYASPTVVDRHKTALGLENVDNTSDANKPVSTATQTALDTKANLAGGNNFGGDQIFTGQVIVNSYLSSDGMVGAGFGFLYSLPRTVSGIGPASDYQWVEALVTDANAPAVGSPVSGGGSAKCKVMSNGVNWIVTAIL
jgi:hypothetical protein